jgi:FixJ family two-component response regulator
MNPPGNEVVLVEDDPGMRKAFEKVLAAAGLRVAAFQSAEALLETATPHQARCFVLDIHLPGLSGFELGKRLRISGDRSPVIFVTALDDEKNREEARTLGAAFYLAKPFPGRRLVEAVFDAMEAE